MPSLFHGGVYHITLVIAYRYHPSIPSSMACLFIDTLPHDDNSR